MGVHPARCSAHSPCATLERPATTAPRPSDPDRGDRTRPADAALHQRHAVQGRLPRHRRRRHPPSTRRVGGRPTRPGSGQPRCARAADGVELMSSLRARSDVPVILVTGYGQDESHPGRRRGRSSRLHRQALLAHRARRKDQGSPAPAHRPRTGRRPRAVQRRRAHHRLRRPYRHRGRPAGAALTHRTPTAVRAVAQRRPSPQPRPADAPSVAVKLDCGPRNRPQRHQETPPQTRRQRHRRFLHHHRAPHGLPNRNSNHPDGTAPEHAALGDAAPELARGDCGHARVGGNESLGRAGRRSSWRAGLHDAGCRVIGAGVTWTCMI